MSPSVSPPVVRVDLAMVGFGHVGRRFTQLLSEQRARLEREHGLACRVVGIATRRHGIAINPAGLDVDQALALASEGRRIDRLHAPDTGSPPSTAQQLIERLGTHRARDPQTPLAVVETTILDIERAAAALDHVRAAFAIGAHVITANKGPAAFAYGELAEQAEAAGVSFLTEGAVLDGIPVFNLVRETLPAVEVVGFRGVVNSTTNHVLTVMEAGGEQTEAFGGDAGRGYCRSGCVARHRRIGRRREDRRAHQRVDARQHDTARTSTALASGSCRVNESGTRNAGGVASSWLPRPHARRDASPGAWRRMSWRHTTPWRGSMASRMRSS